MGIKVANNAFGTLASGINSSATSITLTTGQGARFPSLGASDYFYATLVDTSNNLEIVKVTARSTDVLTVVRGQESTTARAYSTGDRIEIRLTAQTFLDAAAAYPSQTGNSGKFLSTNGTDVSWQDVTPTTVSDKANASTGGFDLPSGTTAQRPGTPLTGYIRLNTTTKYIEYYNGATWVELTVFSPSSISGLVGWYDLTSISGSSWLDKSGQANHATLVNSPSISSVSGNGSTLITQALHGSATNQGVSWPSAILPSNHTLFHVTRYTGATNARIYQTEGPNYLSGFWTTLSGVAYHNAWVTQQSSSVHGNNWVISSDQWDSYRSNGVSRTIASGGTRTSARLVINTGSGLSEFGTWMTTECIVYNRELSLTEIQQIEQYLAAKYGIALG